MRIVRTLMVLTAVAVLLPSPPDDGIEQEAKVSQTGLIGSATMAFADAASFCNRQPQVCQTAGYVAGKLQAKAKYGVRLIYEWASESSAEPSALAPGSEAAVDPIMTGSAVIAHAGRGDAAGQSNLRIEDLIPEWRGPRYKKS